MYKAVPLETPSLEGYNKLLYVSVVDSEIERIFPVVQNRGVVLASLRLSNRTKDICLKAGGLRSEVGAGEKEVTS